MGAAVRIAIKDLKLRVRDRSAFILGLIAPLMLAFIFNTVLGGAVDGGGLSLDYGIVDLDGSEISAAFTSVLTAAESEEILTVETFPDETSAAEAVEEGDIDAFIGFQPFGTRAVQASNELHIVTTGEKYFTEWLMTSTTPEYARTHQPELTAYVRGVHAASTWCKQNREETAQIERGVEGAGLGDRSLRA